MACGRIRLVFATATCTAALWLAAPVAAQDAGATTPPSPPAATTPAPPVAPTPPAPVETPAVPAPDVPPATATPPATPPPAPQGAAPADGGAATTQPVQEPTVNLPEVDVIQAEPKPEPPKAEETPAAKIVKKKPPVQSEPVVVQAKPKPQPKPQPNSPAPQPAAQPEPQPEPVAQSQPATLTPEIKVSPIGGSEVPVRKITGAVSQASAADIERIKASGIQDVLQTSVPGVIVTDLQGNGFQTNVQYRGFEASPVNGVPQGLSVYQNGVRINESFGDIVNWDFIPQNAIKDITVLSGNPVFGLNAIGGAISISMKDGFSFQGAEVDTRFGSFGRIQGSAEIGQMSGPFAVYLAVEGANDDGWRDNSESEIRRMYGDIGYKTDVAEFHFNFTGAKNFIGAVAAAPVELLDIDYGRTFTAPQTTENDMRMYSLNGSVKATDTLTLSGVAYQRRFEQNRIDANILEGEDCGDGTLCIEGEQASGTGTGINPDGTIPADIVDTLASIDNTTQEAKSKGIAVQAVEKTPLFGLGNQFLVGASYDKGDVLYSARSSLGELLPRFFAVPIGINLTGPDDVSPRLLTAENEYFGIYFSDTLDLTDALSVTVGGRYNHADLSIRDLTGRDPFLNADSTFSRFNPMAGATYTFMPGLTLYGSYSEANRAPTPAELACSDPNNPCLIESFLTADPPLKQVVSRTAELGLRGEEKSWSGHERFNWSVGLFRTLNTDDIISLAAPTSGRGYFQNGGDTLRQGIEASVSYRSDRVFMYANYNYVDATFETALTLPSPNSPTGFVCPGADPADPEAPICISVESGDHLPGIPQHKFKAGFDYWITPQWKFGADLVAASSQVFNGDEGNDNRRLAGYGKVDLHTSYDLTENVQLYGLVNNLFDTRYGLFGNFFNLAAASEASLGEIAFTDPRTVVPGAPFAVYGGIKVKF